MVDVIIPNEESLFKRVVEDGFSTGRPNFKELLVLAKDIRKNKGYGEIRIVRELSRIWKEHEPYFNFTMEERFLGRVAKEALKNPNFRAPNYPLMFSGGEMEAIGKVKNFSCQRMFFSALAVAKSSGSPKFFSQYYKTLRLIILISGEKMSMRDFIEWVTRCAYDNGIFENVYSKNKFYSILLDQKEDVVLEINTDEDFASAGEVYRSFTGGTLEWCHVCKEEFVKLSNRHTHCDKCSEEVRREKTRIRVQKHRKKDKL